MAQTFLTTEGYKKLTERLNFLRTTGREEIAQKIKEARSFGDLSENAEYDEAMNDQAKMEAEISRLEEDLKDVEILDTEELSTDVVAIGSFVHVFDQSFHEEMKFQIISKAQANPEEHRISDESPVGKALLGCAVGDVVEVDTPSGPVTFEVREISK